MLRKYSDLNEMARMRCGSLEISEPEMLPQRYLR